MPSATWSFNGYFSPTLLKKNVKRFWPLWGLYGLGLFFLLPAPILSGIYNYMNGWGGYTVGSLRGAISSAPLIGVFYGLFCAMALFHYLMDHRATQMLHSLPIRREGLFLTNWLSALVFILVPNLVIALLTALSAAAARTVGLAVEYYFLRNLLLWLGAGTAIPMFFFCFAMCCAMFTGNLLALPVFYGILNFLVLGVYALVADWLLPNLLAGYAGSAPEWCEWFTPVAHLQMLVYDGSGYKTLEAICYSLVVGCAFTLIALGVYRLRQLERAGDLVTVGWVRPVFQYGFGLCVGLTAGILVWNQFFYVTSSWILMALVVLFAVLGAFGGRMLLKKTLRVFADGWKGVAVMAAALALLLVGIRADFFGYQRWVPQPDQVEDVYISGLDSYPNDGGSYLHADITDPALIQAVTAIHTGVVSDLSRVSPDAPNISTLWDERDCQTQGPVWLELTYAMKNGEVITRRYNGVPIYQSELETEGTYAWRMERLLNEPELIERAYFGDQEPERLEAVDGWLENLRPAQAARQESAVEVEIETVSGEYQLAVNTSQDAAPVLTADQARQLWAAVRADLEEGDIGRRYLLNNAQRKENCYYSDVYLTLAYTDVDEQGNRHTGTVTVGVTVQATSTYTLKALEEMGYKDRLSLREGPDGRG